MTSHMKFNVDSLQNFIQILFLGKKHSECSGVVLLNDKYLEWSAQKGSKVF